MNPHLEKIYQPVRAQLKQVDRIIQQATLSRSHLIPEISAHLTQGGGKRIRPTLLIATARACGYRGQRTATLGAAIELLHTATLLHDDVVDGSERRRGRPSAHTIFGNSASILVGDYILARAVSLVMKDGNLDYARPLAFVTVQLAEGEAAQLARRGTVPKEKEYLSIITDKTALLFSVACQMGATVAGASKAKVKSLRNYGLNFGIAFQLIDDCLDYLPGPGGAGKDWGRDLNEGKVTLPLLHALKLSRISEREQILKLIKLRAKNSSSPLSASTVHKVRDFILKYRGFEYTREQARIYTELAKAHLLKIQPAKKRKFLEELADTYLNRQS